MTNNQGDLTLVERLAKFFDEAADCWMDGRDMDGGDIQDAGVRLGLLVETEFDPDVHEDTEGFGVEPGDPWFIVAPDVKRILKALNLEQSHGV